MSRALWMLVLALCACQDLRDVDADGRCGNDVVEPLAGEDCDGLRHPDGSECGDPGTPEACEHACGSPGTPAACHYTCVAGEGSPSCPAGWACGLDGLCRAYSGEFDAPRITPLAGTDLAVGDADADGRDDVVAFGNTRLVIAYGDADGRFGSQLVLPSTSPDVTPALADLDGDGTTDLVVPVSAGAQVLRGQPNRSAAPVAVAESEIEAEVTALHPVPVRAVPPFDRDVILQFLETAGGLQVRADRRETRAAGVDAVLAEIGGRPANHQAVASIDGEGTAEEVAVALTGAREVPILSVECDPAPPAMGMAGGAPMAGGPCTVEVRDRLALPRGHVVTGGGGAWFAPGGAFGLTDLFVTARGPEGLTLLVSHIGEDGVPGRLGLWPGDPTVILRCARCGNDMSGDADSGLLAVGDINDDSVADFVQESGVYFTTPGDMPKVQRVLGPIRPWGVAVIADLNGDGRTDVAGARPGTLDILLSNREGGLNALRGELAGEAGQLSVGDFDGDLVNDIALVENGDQVVVLFAGVQRTPSDRVIMARTGTVERMVAWRNPDNDPIDDLFLASARPQVAGMQPPEPGRLLIDLEGASSRRMLAPIRRAGPVYSSVSAGRFAGDARTDLVLAEMGGGMRRTVRYFLVPGEAPLDREPVLPAPLTPDCVVPDKFAVRSGVADLDGDAEDELLVLETHSPEPPVEGSEWQAGQWRLWILRVEGDALKCVLPGAVKSPLPPTALHVADLDGDGALDAVAPLGTSDLPMPDAPTETRPTVAIWWGRAGGGLDAPELVALGEVGPTERLEVRPLETDGDAASELILLQRDALALLSFDADRTLDRRDLERPPPGARRLVVADEDGDGLDGFVVGTASEILIFRHTPCTAAGAANNACDRTEP